MEGIPDKRVLLLLPRMATHATTHTHIQREQAGSILLLVPFSFKGLKNLRAAPLNRMNEEESPWRDHDAFGTLISMGHTHALVCEQPALFYSLSSAQGAQVESKVN